MVVTSFTFASECRQRFKGVVVADALAAASEKARSPSVGLLAREIVGSPSISRTNN